MMNKRARDRRTKLWRLFTYPFQADHWAFEQAVKTISIIPSPLQPARKFAGHFRTVLVAGLAVSFDRGQVISNQFRRMPTDNCSQQVFLSRLLCMSALFGIGLLAFLLCLEFAPPNLLLFAQPLILFTTASSGQGRPNPADD
jgi:hypothetical protein